MAIISASLADTINNLSPGHQVAQIGTRLKEALEGDVPNSSIELDEISNELILARSIVSAKTTSREENIAGLSSAITLANALKVTLNTHAADATEHTTAADATNFPLTSADASNLVTLITLTGEMLTDYEAHNDDAVLGSSWAFHEAQQAGNGVASAVAPVTLQECVTKLNDLKAKYNTHEGSATSHLVGGAQTEAASDTAYGNSILVLASGVSSGDSVLWGILNNGTGSVTGTSVSSASGELTFVFSADPQNDCVINYVVFRGAGV